MPTGGPRPHAVNRPVQSAWRFRMARRRVQRRRPTMINVLRRPAATPLLDDGTRRVCRPRRSSTGVQARRSRPSTNFRRRIQGTGSSERLTTLRPPVLVLHVEGADPALRERNAVRVQIGRTRSAENTEMLMRHSPFGQFPLLLDGDTAVFESTPIIDYLDACTPRTRTAGFRMVKLVAGRGCWIASSTST